MSDKELINELKEWRAYHLAAAEKATRLISKLEGDEPSSSRKGLALSEEERMQNKMKLRKRFYK